MSKEQINLPTDGGKKEDQDQSSGDIKSLKRPKLPDIKGREVVGYKCSCGIYRRQVFGCVKIPVYSGDPDEGRLP